MGLAVKVGRSVCYKLRTRTPCILANFNCIHRQYLHGFFPWVMLGKFNV